MTLHGKKILCIISGGIAAYKVLELIRLIKKQGGDIRCILTKGGAEFVTPLSVAALSENDVYTDLFSLKDETEMGHIRLSREADVVLVAPATANILAKMAHGLSDDLASTTLLATNKPVYVAPAMNPMMWENAATQANITTLKNRNIPFIAPESGDMACGETGEGRLAAPETILQHLLDFMGRPKGALSGKTAIVTSGPTYEPLDPVRFIGNYSSGKQGIAIATALAAAGAETTLITGPTHQDIPETFRTLRITTARDMLAACEEHLPCDIAVCAAAVADWRAKDIDGQKIKKQDGQQPPSLDLVENPDILKTIANAGNKRPPLVIGFAAETEDIVKKATAKLKRKNCDWIVANDVGTDTDTFGGDNNTVHLLKAQADAKDTPTIDAWPMLSKTAVAEKLVEQIITTLSPRKGE